ncbi:Peptidase S1 domain-containing protein [Aphelenchoides bicaudatus]|nr:Peptidase S1 domain-containing protein [Aphelenchoides bicaudatus]
MILLNIDYFLRFLLVSIAISNARAYVEAGFYHSPENSTLTKVTEEESRQLGSICGRPTATRKYPWAVSLSLHGFNKLGGVIISPYHILVQLLQTVAHGFVRFNSAKPGPCNIINYKEFKTIAMKRVMFGSDCIHFARTPTTSIPTCKETNLKIRFIKAAVVDHSFAENTCIGGHDWAIIEVDKPIVFDESVSPICLPFKRRNNVRPILTAVSWGRSSFFNESEAEMREIPMAYDPSCSAPWGDEMPTKNDYLCAKSVDPSNYASKRTCHGDSGAGLHQTDQNGVSTLMGLTSFGSPGCPPNELARFTRISEYIDNICEMTGVCYTSRKRKRRI